MHKCNLTQKSKYLENKEKFFLHIKGYFIAKNSFVAEVTFNTRNREFKKHPLSTMPCLPF